MVNSFTIKTNHYWYVLCTLTWKFPCLPGIGSDTRDTTSSTTVQNILDSFNLVAIMFFFLRLKAEMWSIKSRKKQLPLHMFHIAFSFLLGRNFLLFFLFGYKSHYFLSVFFHQSTFIRDLVGTFLDDTRKQATAAVLHWLASQYSEHTVMLFFFASFHHSVRISAVFCKKC